MPGTTALYGYNGHGDVINLTSEGTVVAAYYYDEFGNHADIENYAGVFAELFTDEESTEFDNPYRYAGYEYLENADLYDLNARYYDAKIARFLSPDPYYDLGNRVIGLYEINVPTAWSIIQANALYVYCGNSPMLYFDPFGFEGSPRYVSVSTTLNMRDSYGTGSNIIGSLPNNAEVMYYGNKTREIDGHMWAEVSYNGITGWVAADFLRIARPKQVSKQPAVSTSSTTAAMTLDSYSLDDESIQNAFQKYLEINEIKETHCPYAVKFFIECYTTLQPTSGNGCMQVENLAKQASDLTISTIPSAPAVYSIAPSSYGPGVREISSENYGHTAIVLECRKISESEYRIKYFHTYIGVKKEGAIFDSDINEKTFSVSDNVTYLDLSNYMRKDR